MRIDEINARLAEIRADMEQRGDQLTEAEVAAYETEVQSLTTERAALMQTAERRNGLLAQLAQGDAGVSVRGFTENGSAAAVDPISTPEYRAAWLKNLQGRPEAMTAAEKRAYATTDTHTAIPTLVADKFFEKMKKLAPMLSEITLMRVAGNIKFMVEGTRNAASKHTENNAVSAAADTVVSVTLGANEFMKVIGISKAAANQNIDQFENWLVEMLSGDIARAIDDFIINDSSNGIAAITYTTGTNQILNTATTGYTYGNIMDLIALLPAAYDAEAKFLVHKKTLWGKIRGIVDSTGRPIFDPVEKTLCGYPVVVDDYVATANNGLYLGRWLDVVGNLSEGVNVERNDNSGFLSATIHYRGYAAFDSKPAKNDAIVRLVSTTA